MPRRASFKFPPLEAIPFIAFPCIAVEEFQLCSGLHLFTAARRTPVPVMDFMNRRDLIKLSSFAVAAATAPAIAESAAQPSSGDAIARWDSLELRWLR